MKLEITGKNGALTNYRITEASEVEIEQIREIATYYVNVNGDQVSGSANKRQIQQFRHIEERSTQAVETKTTTNNGRRIVSLEQAEREGLSHGKAWFCTGYHVDAKNVSPELEGLMICYAYGE